MEIISGALLLLIVLGGLWWADRVDKSKKGRNGLEIDLWQDQNNEKK